MIFFSYCPGLLQSSLIDSLKVADTYQYGEGVLILSLFLVDCSRWVTAGGQSAGKTQPSVGALLKHTHSADPYK